ncbi:pre-tRNA nuclear export protein, partial [Nowakowskiella sp. JEL0078]
MVVTGQLHHCEIIRAAARETCQKMIGCAGPLIIEFVTPIIKHGVLSIRFSREIVSYQPLLTSLMFKCKDAVIGTMNEMLGPLLDLISVFLNQTISGTDEDVELKNLKRSYLQLILGIFNADCQNILLSEENASKLNTILQSILTYSSEFPDVLTQKIALNLLTAIISAWATNPDLPLPVISGMIGATNGNKLNPSQTKKQIQQQQQAKIKKKQVPEFVSFLYSNIIPVLFKIPLIMNRTWELDAQANQVITEIAAVHRSVWLARGAEEYRQWLEGWIAANLGLMVSSLRADGVSRTVSEIEARELVEGFVRALADGKRNFAVFLK